MSRRESDLERELQFHVEERVAALVAGGMNEQEARRHVRAEFGGIDSVSEACRDVRPWRMLERLAANVRYALRGMRRRPLAAATATLTVAACVAVNSAVFTVVDSLLLRPMPFPDADRLVAMTNLYPKAGVTDQDAAASGDYFDRDGAVSAVSAHALYQFASYPVEQGGRTIQLQGLQATPSLLPMLRVSPARGRNFSADEGEPGRDGVVILTRSLAREMFGGADAVGRMVRINGRPRQVVGVLPAGFRFVSADARFIVPLAFSAEEKRSHHANNFRYAARLRDGATVAQAQAQVDALNENVSRQLPNLRQILKDAGFHTRVAQLQPWLMRKVAPSLWLLWAGAALVLIAGAANLAGLSIARAHAKIPEMATRLALGASRREIAMQALIDGLMPALAGGLIGMVIGGWAAQSLDPALVPGAAEIRLSAAVMAYAFAGAALAGIFSGLMSLIPLTRLQRLRASVAATRGATLRGTRLRRVFVVGQVAVAFVLFAGAALLVASMREILKTDPGYATAGVWTASTYLPNADYPANEDRRAAVNRLTTAIRGLPGVTAAGAASHLPLGSKYDDNVIFAEGYTRREGESAISPVVIRSGAGYFEALGIAPLEGRLFDSRDTIDSQRVIIVDERLARRFWPGRSPIGRMMYYPLSPRNEWMTVVAVVPSIRLQDLTGAGNPNGVYYLPFSQTPSRRVELVWRGDGSTVAAVRNDFFRLVPGAALFDVRSMEERLDVTLSARRTAQALVVVFAAVAVLLTILGINGLLAFLVAQRHREIGVRLAIGCRPAGIFALFMREGAGLVFIGLVAGFAVAAAMKTSIAEYLYGVAPLDAGWLAASAIAVAALALAAVSLPAIRAARVDPVRAIRDN